MRLKSIADSVHTVLLSLVYLTIFVQGDKLKSSWDQVFLWVKRHSTYCFIVLFVVSSVHLVLNTDRLMTLQ